MTSGPSFRFRLERVRALRERREKLAQQELAAAISRLSSSQEEVRSAELDVERAQVHARTEATTESALSGTELQDRQAFLERVEAERRQRMQELRLREAEVAERDADLATAATDHEMLKRLRERHRDAHDRAASRTERNLLDEIPVLRHGSRTA